MIEHPLKNDRKYSENFFFTLEGSPWLNEAKKTFAAFNAALGFEALPPWPESYAETQTWAVAHAGETGCGEWGRAVRPSRKDDFYAVKVVFTRDIWPPPIATFQLNETGGF